MEVEARYAAGTGLLLGTARHWLLLDGSPEDRVVERLWHDLGAGSDVPGRVLATVDRELGGPAAGSLVLVDVDSGSVRGLCRGSGELREQDGTHLARLRPADSLGAVRGLRPFGGGVVEASVLALTVAAPAAGPQGPSHDIIDGIPPEILAGSPGQRQPTPTVPAVPADPAHDGATTRRAGPVDHLRHHTHETVLAVRCPAGHLTAAFDPTCRVCRLEVRDEEPERVPRPRLGGLVLPTGESVPLDRGVVLGRRPRPVPGAGDWPHLVHLPQDSTYLSRLHLQIELDGWMVLARDLGSRGGTTLRVPGRPPQRIRPEESHVLEPGHVLDLADVYPVRFEVP